MPSRSDSRQYRAPRSVRLDGALSRYVAEGGSRSVGGAHQKELRTWATARQFIACYCTARALRAIESLRACIATVTRPVTPARILAADAADRAEEAAQTAYLLDPNPTTRETLIRAVYAEVAEQSALARDLEAEAR